MDNNNFATEMIQFTKDSFKHTIKVLFIIIICLIGYSTFITWKYINVLGDIGTITTTDTIDIDNVDNIDKSNIGIGR